VFSYDPERGPVAGRIEYRQELLPATIGQGFILHGGIHFAAVTPITPNVAVDQVLICGEFCRPTGHGITLGLEERVLRLRHRSFEVVQLLGYLLKFEGGHIVTHVRTHLADLFVSFDDIFSFDYVYKSNFVF